MIFYLVVAFIIGIILFISAFLNKEKIYKLIMFIFGFIYLALGIGGFFVDSNFEWVYILVLIAICVIFILIFGIENKKNKK